MTIIKCETEVISDCISNIHDLLVKNGASFNENLEIIESNGMLSINMPKVPPTESPIMSLPSDLLLPLSKFDFKLNNNEIIIDRTDASITAIQKQLMEYMVNLYNHTNKIEYHIKLNTIKKHYRIIFTAGTRICLLVS